MLRVWFPVVRVWCIGKPAAGESSPQASFLISVRTRALPRRTRARGAETRAPRGGVGVWTVAAFSEEEDTALALEL